MMSKFLLGFTAAYLGLGALFALPFVLYWVGRIDPHARGGTWGFRVLILPGAVLLWPLLVRRLLRGVDHPPEESTPHRCRAGRKEAA